MCGLTGFWSTDFDRLPARLIDEMTDTLEHRGPDGRGVWTDDDAGIALGHRRLAIIDLSKEGAQPMESASGRYVIIYNGEIYNFARIRRDVRARRPEYRFRGDSDTEVLLAAIEVFGLDEALERANGMFAFALWDRQQRNLSLVRDRLGIKPMYVGRVGSSLVFGSELKPFVEMPGFDGRIDRQALADLLRLNSIPAPRSIYDGIKKLEPGAIETYDAPDASARFRRYWTAGAVATGGLQSPFEGSPEAAVDELEHRLLQAVDDRMIADVPLGAFLSGGIDSSTVVALMQSISNRPVKTFSIGFHEEEYNEATDAADVADHLGTDHTEQYVTADEARDVIPRLPTLYDEPFADSSQIPTFLVSQIARRDVTVALSGDGGDELFGGYNRHLWAPRLWQLVGPIPQPIRRAVSKAMLLPDPAGVDAIYNRLESLIPKPLRIRLPAEKLQKLARMIAVSSIDEVYARLRADWPDPASVVVGLDADRPLRRHPPQQAGFAERMMYLDLVSYLPDDILTKVDRASMGVSLEARVPLLDDRVVDFAWRLPMEFKIREGTTKWALRQVLYRHVPRPLLERPKMGFGIPIDRWLRGSLRDWAEALLAPARLRREGFFEVEPIRQIWREHVEGRANHQHRLWNVLTFQAWLEHRR